MAEAAFTPRRLAAQKLCFPLSTTGDSGTLSPSGPQHRAHGSMLIRGLIVVLASFISLGASWATWITWTTRNQGECISKQIVMSCVALMEGAGPVSL